jgi:hypothetical protein
MAWPRLEHGYFGTPQKSFAFSYAVKPGSQQLQYHRMALSAIMLYH